MAQDMENWFRRKYKKLPRTKDEEWMILLKKASKKMLMLSKNVPANLSSGSTKQLKIGNEAVVVQQQKTIKKQVKEKKSK